MAQTYATITNSLFQVTWAPLDEGDGGSIVPSVLPPLVTRAPLFPRCKYIRMAQRTKIIWEGERAASNLPKNLVSVGGICISLRSKDA